MFKKVSIKSLLTLFAGALVLIAAHKVFANNLGYPSTQPVIKKTIPQKSSQSGARTYTCKYRLGDMGTIVGVGVSQQAAHADAVEQCFYRQVDFYEKIRGQAIDMERGQDFIDSCVNITCS